jgi:ubiquinone/menaquinone biosynthesis C-methylase UbiE
MTTMASAIPARSPVSSVRSESGSVQALPEYAPELAAFHAAFARELRDAVAQLPIHPDMRGLDAGCGDGFYMQLLAERLGPDGFLVGLDANRACLDSASRRLASRPISCATKFIQGTLEQRPVAEASCDFVWCAQSLFSLHDPVLALRQMGAALRPGGLVAVLENDTLHQLLLPWPGHLEVAVKRAELAALDRESPRSEKYYVGRRLPQILAAAGLEPIAFHTQCIDRSAPCDENLLEFLTRYLSRLSDRVEPFLDEQSGREFRALVNPRGAASMFTKSFFTLSWLNMLAWGRKP